MGRTIVVMGHYGSGKSEFSVNLAIDLAKTEEHLALIDMDIANPYFRSRERQQMLEDLGIDVYFNHYGFDIAEDLPAITAKVRAPLENPEFTTIVDVGGNDSGARIINQFHKYFESDDTERYLVVNANRFETDTIEGARFHLQQIETEIQLPINGLINNTHMLAETTADDVIRGHKLCKQLSDETGIPIVYETCNVKFLDDLKERADDYDEYKVYPIELQLRPSWLDVKF